MPDKGNYREGGFLQLSVSEGVGHHGGEGVTEFLLLTRSQSQELGSFAWSIYNLQGSLLVAVISYCQLGHTLHKSHSLQNDAISPGLRTQT